MNKSLSYVNLSLKLHVVSTFWLGRDTSRIYFFFTFCPVIIRTWETSLEDWKMLLHWCRNYVCSWKLSAKVSLMLENPFLVPSLCKLNHISLCFIQISTKSPANSLFPSGKAMFFLKSSPVFWAARWLSVSYDYALRGKYLVAVRDTDVDTCSRKNVWCKSYN